MYTITFPDGTKFEDKSLKKLIKNTASLYRWINRMIPYYERVDRAAVYKNDAYMGLIISIGAEGISICYQTKSAWIKEFY